MDKEIIKRILPGTLATNDLHLLPTMRIEVAKLYAAYGKHNTMTPQQLSQDVEMIAQNINTEMKRDPAYKNVRTKEIVYLFTEVIKGNISQDKTITVSLSRIWQWIAEYMRSEERRRAVQEWVAENAPKEEVKGLPAKQYTEADYWQWLNKKYNQFKEWKNDPTPKNNLFKKQPIPMCAMDYGGCLTAFLKAKGLLHEGQTLYTFFCECYDFGMDQIEF